MYAVAIDQLGSAASAIRSLSLRSEWATPGGTATNPPEETVIVSGSRPISKVRSPSRT
jgi:hypothetical protein